MYCRRARRRGHAGARQARPLPSLTLTHETECELSLRPHPVQPSNLFQHSPSISACRRRARSGGTVGGGDRGSYAGDIPPERMWSTSRQEARTIELTTTTACLDGINTIGLPPAVLRQSCHPSRRQSPLNREHGQRLEMDGSRLRESAAVLAIADPRSAILG